MWSKEVTATVTEKDYINEDACAQSFFTGKDGKRYTAIVEYDYYNESPRVGDDLWAWVTNVYSDGDRPSPELRKELEAEGALVVPMYLYRHGGDVISSSPFSCRFDSACMGFAYVSKKDVLMAFGRWQDSDTYIPRKRLTKSLIEEAYAALEAEVKYMNKYLSGEIFAKTIKCLDDDEIIESWGGYYFENDDDMWQTIALEIKRLFGSKEEALEALKEGRIE